MKKIMVLCFSLFVMACGDKKAEVVGTHTIWIGNSIAAAGYETNGYKKDDGMIEFIVLSTGKKKIVPVCNVHDIDVNT